MGRQMETLSSLVTITGETQANRIQALIQLFEDRTGAPLTYKMIEEALASRYVPISRSTWHKLTSFKDRVPNFKILAVLGNFFDVPTEYMISEAAEDPEQVLAQMHLLHTIKVQTVMDFAVRKLGVLDPVVCDAMRNVLNARRPLHDATIPGNRDSQG